MVDVCHHIFAMFFTKEERTMRRTILLLAMVAMVMAMSSVAALAVTKDCHAGVVCKGTSDDDILTGTREADTIKSFAGNDRITGKGGNDQTKGGSGDDVYRYSTGWGKDEVTDASGTDTLNFSTATNFLSIILEPHPRFEEAGEYECGAEQCRRVSRVDWTSDTATVENVVGGKSHDFIVDDFFGRTDNRMSGYKGDDYISGTGGDDTYDGGDGADFFDEYGDFETGEGTDETYKFSGGFGNDIIWEFLGEDRAKLDAYSSGDVSAVYRDLLTLNKDGSDDGLIDSMRLKFDDGSKLLIIAHFDNTSADPNNPGGPGYGHVETIQLADGPLSLAGLQATFRETSARETAATRDMVRDLSALDSMPRDRLPADILNARSFKLR